MAKKRSSSEKKNDVHELEILFPERSVEIAGRSITIKEYSFLEALRLLSVAEPIISALKQKYTDIPDFEEAQELLLKHKAEVAFLISQSCNLTAQEITQLTPEEGVVLLGVWWEVNKYGLFEFFKEINNRTTNKNNHAWTNNITYLLKNGFSLNDTKQLTIRQLKLYTQSLGELERHKMADHITVVSVGTNGGKETAKIVKDLRK